MEVIFFKFLACFLLALVVTYLQIQQTKNADLQSFSQAISLQYSKSQGNRLVTEPVAFWTETRKNESRDSISCLETTSLHC